MPRSSPFLPAIGIALCATILALHAGLLPEAHWQGDDFICAAFARAGGWRYLWQARIGGWSPRPLSELLFYGFGRLAAASLQPFTLPFLALLWGMLFATTLVTRRRGAGPVRILAGLSIACMFLLGHRVAELFFWPAGAVAYLTTLAADSLILFLLVDGRGESLPGVCALSAALAAGAASSESGAIAAVPLALVLTATRPTPSRMAILLPPALLVAGFVFWVLAHHRMVSAEATRHVPLARFWRGLGPMSRTLLADALSLWPAKLCLALGLRWSGVLAAPGTRPRRALLGIAFALLLAACVSIATGFFQFGTSCCERHDSLRQCWIVLALAALAIASTRTVRAATRAGPALLILACLLGMAPRLSAIASDYRLMPAIVAAQRANWRDGRDRAGADMVFRLPPEASLAGTIGILPGRYREPASHDWTAHGVMQFFGKQRIAILPPTR